MPGDNGLRRRRTRRGRARLRARLYIAASAILAFVSLILWIVLFNIGPDRVPFGLRYEIAISVPLALLAVSIGLVSQAARMR